MKKTREAAVLDVKEIVQILGASWTEQNILQNLLQLSNSTNYLNRETLLFILMVKNLIYIKKNIKY